MTTIHINAQKGDFAKTVLMPGDPLRAKFIADNFLENATEVTNIRNMLGFTGYFNGNKISVMGSGMGIPSCSIYAHELYTAYDVENIIRIGTAGGLANTKLGQIILANGASTDSMVNRNRLNGFDFAATAKFELLLHAYQSAIQLNIPVTVGGCFSADLFYNPNDNIWDKLINMGIACVEMEAAGLYGVAAECNKKALAILTISDLINQYDDDKQPIEMSSEERQTNLKNMIQIALNMHI